LAALDGTLMEEYISRELTLTAPSAVNTTTAESALNLRGSADPNFPLTMNGQPVTLTEHGFFSLDQTLKIGDNRFTFVHKGKTVTYTVNYKVQVLKSIAPSSALTLDGGATITLSAVAHKNATVYAMLNGTKVPMKATPLQAEEGGGDELSDYENYVGSYTLPAGIIGKTQALGAVTVYAQYQSLSETRTGGSVTVKALPEPPKPTQPGDPSEPNTPPDIQPIDPANGGETLKTGMILIITADYAETFSGDTTDDYSRPTNAYLPKGTTDVYVKTVYDAASDHTYYLLGCGRRVYQQDAAVYRENGTLTANKLTVGDVTVNGKGTTLRFSSDWRVPYQLQLLPQTYGNPVKQDYNITAQTTEYIDITFYYTTAAENTPDVSASPLFRSAEWRTAGNTRVLRLYLTQKAQFYGYTVGWDNDGTLTFTFKHPASLKGNDAEKPLTGFTVVLDAGHGGNSIGTSGGKIAEKTLTLAYAQELRSQLEALGAKVVMTRSDDSALSLEERVAITRKANADLFISLHMDGSTSSTVHGCSVHYFNEYSMLPSKLVYEAMNKVYTAAGATSSRGYKWDPFYVTRLHDAPAMLIECGFMTNAGDLELLIDAGFRERLTAAIADGVVAYAATLP
jgi:N-acetylmuramoyl-L-alanine amidase